MARRGLRRVHAATAGLDVHYLNDVCVSLTNNSVSPQSMYLVYCSLFETVGRQPGGATASGGKPPPALRATSPETGEE